MAEERRQTERKSVSRLTKAKMFHNPANEDSMPGALQLAAAGLSLPTADVFLKHEQYIPA